MQQGMFSVFQLKKKNPEDRKLISVFKVTCKQTAAVEHLLCETFLTLDCKLP